MYYYFILQMKEGMCRVFKYPPKSHNCTFSEMNLNPDVSYFRPSVYSSCATMSSSINFKHFFASFIKTLLNWKKNIFKRCFFFRFRYFLCVIPSLILQWCLLCAFSHQSLKSTVYLSKKENNKTLEILYEIQILEHFAIAPLYHLVFLCIHNILFILSWPFFDAVNVITAQQKLKLTFVPIRYHSI